MKDFWTRRRAAVEAEEHVLTLEEEQAEREAQELALTERSDDELLAELALPQPENVDSAELLQQFMRSALPRRLKQRALRQYWTRKPVFACLDGLVDYADDFTDAATCVPDLQTTYQVGKGLLAHVEALAQQREAQEQGISPDELPEAEVAPEAVETEPHEISEAVETPQDNLHYEASSGNKRRMRFRFEGVV